MWGQFCTLMPLPLFQICAAIYQLLLHMVFTSRIWFVMLASHCPEIDTRWTYEYGILNLARRWPRTWSTANEQRKQVRCQQKVTRWHPNHTRRQHKDVNFYSSLYPQDTRRPYDGYTTSYWEYDAFELGHEGVTWPPNGIKLSVVGNSVADRRHDDNNNKIQ
jgi:hypothetical protein